MIRNAKVKDSKRTQKHGHGKEQAMIWQIGAACPAIAERSPRAAARPRRTCIMQRQLYSTL